MYETDPAIAQAVWLVAMFACIVGGGLGLGALVRPGWASRIVNLIAKEGKPEGKSEFRATYGGLFLFTHAFVLWALATEQYGASLAAGVLSAAWLGSAIGRLVSFIADRAATKLNVFNALFELVLGTALAAPLVFAP